MSILLKDIIPYQIELVTYPIFVIIPIIFMALVIIISAYIPAKKASKISPIEAIRQNTDIQINKKKIKTLGIVKKIFGIEGEIALKNIKRNKKKYRITIISLFISIVTFISFSTLKYCVLLKSCITVPLSLKSLVFHSNINKGKIQPSLSGSSGFPLLVPIL